MASRDEYSSSRPRDSQAGRPGDRSSQAPRSGSNSRYRRQSSGALPPREDNPQRPTEQRTRRASGTRGQSEYRDSSVHRTRTSARPSAAQTNSYSEKPRPRAQPGVSVRSLQSATTPLSPSNNDLDPMLEAGAPGRGIGNASDLGRKKSMVRPERRRIDPDNPDYYYRKHAQKMDVMPSTTGVDPQIEEDMVTLGSDETLHDLHPQPSDLSGEKSLPSRKKSGVKRDPSRKQASKLRKTEYTAAQESADKRKQRIKEAHAPPTLWGAYCHLITFFIPNMVLRWFGKRQREQQRAWREKIGLVSLILLTMLFVGFLTFGFTETVCPQGGPLRLRVNKVGPGYMIFHGQAYDLTRSSHPLARGVPQGSNVLWDGSMPGAGKDGSFLFQNVNGACKGLITPAAGSDVVTDSSGNLAWYFPCNLYNQDGSSSPNETIPYYLGYACHTSKNARQDFYNLRSSGDVYFTWEDVKNTTRNLMVYSGDVLDLDLLEWFNKTQVVVPDLFTSIREDPAVRGKDVTISFSSGESKQIAQCFQEIIKVGSIDTETIGCIASKVVLYISLIFILSIVVIKFILAIIFQWFLSRKYAAGRTSMGSDKKKRQQQIEDWTEDIYRPPPKITDPGSVGGSDRPLRRTSFLPTTSRFTSPYAIERSMNKTRLPPQTMVSQSQQSTTKLLSSSGYAHVNQSEGTLPTYMDSARDRHSSFGGSMSGNDRYSSVLHPDTEVTSGPQGFIHDAVVPQPPPEWQPFGFPLAHTICLVTAYSEGPAGIRTTLDSIAMTDYPNSHKVLYVVCDGLIKGKGESMSTPDACISMMRDFAIPPEEVAAYSYVAVASGSKRHNMAKVYCGFYDYGVDSIIPVEKQQRVPMVLIVKCGTPAEANSAKPGNRGKRDSQIVLMSFLQKVMFDERMTELEYEMFNGIWRLTGISPDFYETVLMVDADTKVFPDSLTHLVSAMVKDPEIMGICGETKIANKAQSWVTMIQVFEYFISHHLIKSFESVFGGVTCLPGCFCMYRIKAPKGGQNYWVPILANPDIVEHYSENVVDTLHKKNLLLLGEDRYLTSLMLKTFPKRKQMFVPQAVCKTTVPDTFKVLLSQRRRWINSTVHNLMELILVRDLCGTFCFSMQFVLFIDLIGTLVLPAAIAFTIYVIALGIKAAITHTTAPVIPLVLLALILGLPGVLIVITAQRVSYVGWMFAYLLSLPIWNFALPVYAFWHFDDFSWGDTRQAAGDTRGADKSGHGGDGEFDSSKITMKRWGDFEQERRLRQPNWAYAPGMSERPYSGYGGKGSPSTVMTAEVRGHERKPSNLVL